MPLQLPHKYYSSFKITGYPFLKRSAFRPAFFPQIGVLSAAAYRDPVLSKEWRVNMQRKWMRYSLVRMKAVIACLVLAAWGCDNRHLKS